MEQNSHFSIQIHRLSFQIKKIISQDKLDLLDFDHIIKENKYEKMSRGFDKCQTFFEGFPKFNDFLNIYILDI